FRVCHLSLKRGNYLPSYRVSLPCHAQVVLGGNLAESFGWPCCEAGRPSAREHADVDSVGVSRIRHLAYSCLVRPQVPLPIDVSLSPDGECDRRIGQGIACIRRNNAKAEKLQMSIVG